MMLVISLVRPIITLCEAGLCPELDFDVSMHIITASQIGIVVGQHTVGPLVVAFI